MTVSPDDMLEHGPQGCWLDAVYVRRSHCKGMDALLAGLKAHAEGA